MPRMSREKWKQVCREIVLAARKSGNRATKREIVEDHFKRMREVRSRMYGESHRDREIAETIAKGNYPELGVFSAEVMSQGRRYIHPALLPR
jgi:hypothetical protein